MERNRRPARGHPLAFSREGRAGNAGRTLFAHRMDRGSPNEFRQGVDRSEGHDTGQRFTCWDPFLCLAFAHLTLRESLRDIPAYLRLAQPKLYHMGFRGSVARIRLAQANEVRAWRHSAAVAPGLIATTRPVTATEACGSEAARTA